jgi:ribonuclease J
MADTDLLFLPLGGSGEIGMNLNLFGYGGKWVMVDLGMTFAGSQYPGVEIVLPDTSFIEEHRDDLLGIVLTHGHEDHIGAIPYLAAEFDVPLYATPFTAGLIRHKLQEAGLERDVKLKTIPLGGSLQLGPFGFRYVALAHSIAEGNALLIDTPHGKIFHTGDWKLDDEPLIGTPSSAAELTKIGDEGVLAYIGDSTNVFNLEASGSEGGVRDAMQKLLQGQRGRVVVTTFASNVARLDTVGRVAQATGRKLVLAGRSMDRIARIAKETGYLKDFPPLLDMEDVSSVEPDQLMIVCTGCQGEPQAALSRIASGNHPHIKLSRGDLVVFSSKKIPGNEIGIGEVHNQLVRSGVRVITEKDAHVHVSGHPGRPELEAMLGWIRPKIAVPVHGEARHMQEHALVAKACGVPQQVVPSNGTIIRLAPGPAKIIDHAPVGRWVLDGDVIIPHDGQTIIERRRLQQNGIVTATLVIGKGGKLAAEPKIIVQGVPVEEDREAFIEEAAQVVEKAFYQAADRDEARLVEHVRIALRRLARDYTGKKPVTEISLIRL